MEFVTLFFASLFANNLLLAGKGVRQTALFQSKKHGWVLALFFFIEAMALAVVALFIRRFVAELEVLKYLSILIFAFVMAIFTFIFDLMVNHVFKDEIREDLKDHFATVSINSALMAIAFTVFTIAANTSWLSILGIVLGLPLGYLVFNYICGALMERFEISSAPKGFKGIPLLLICLSGLALSLSMLHF